MIAAQALTRLPEHLAAPRLAAILLVLVVDAAEQQPVEAELSEERGLLARMPKRVDLPGDARPRARTKLVQDEAEAERLLVYDVLVVRGAFVTVLLRQ